MTCQSILQSPFLLLFVILFVCFVPLTNVGWPLVALHHCNENTTNFELVYQSQMVHPKTSMDVTLVQPAFQYHGKECKLIYRMVSLLDTI